MHYVGIPLAAGKSTCCGATRGMTLDRAQNQFNSCSKVRTAGSTPESVFQHLANSSMHYVGTPLATGKRTRWGCNSGIDARFLEPKQGLELIRILFQGQNCQFYSRIQEQVFEPLSRRKKKTFCTHQELKKKQQNYLTNIKGDARVTMVDMIKCKNDLDRCIDNGFDDIAIGSPFDFMMENQKTGREGY